MKQYWVFSGYDYYPYGGISDLDVVFSTLDEAKTKGKALLDQHHAWAQIVLVEENKCQQIWRWRWEKGDWVSDP